MRYVYLLAILATLIIASCSGNTDSAAIDNSTPELLDKGDLAKGTSTVYSDPDADWTWELIAGQHYLAGTVTVTNDEDTLYVTYNMDPAWPLSEAHVYVGTEQPKKGAPGQFPYKQEFNPAVFTYTFEIPLDGFAGKSQIFLATHAKTGSETAWGGNWNNGSPSWDFGWGKKWGGGFTTNVMPMPELPDDSVTYRGYHYGTMSYWNMRFFDPVTLPPGSFFQGGIEYWAGWCVDKNHTMYPNHDYEVTLYSTYDQNLPAFAQNDNWDLVNYMVNARRNNGTGIWDQNWNSNAIKDQFQAACWKFSDGLDPAPGSLAEAFVNDAIANGEDFIPGPGEFYAILLYPDTSTNNNQVRAQMNIIEVDP
ncbi:MAG: hypothetical protein H7A35_03515 [Planctomycetales bacterium]|nr:hypothetical protein [bacterium]UNM09123.1 MAG: hypothetical protein H7A35_03515 [Planctomycetales bacterium]